MSVSSGASDDSANGGRPRPSMRVESLTLAVSAFVVLLHNTHFWHEIFRVAPPSDVRHYFFVAALVLVLLVVTNLLLSLFAFPRVAKLAVIVILMSSAVTAYFMDEIGVPIDDTMIVNVLQTDHHEVLELINLRMLAYVFLLGVLPSIAVCRLRIRYRDWVGTALAKLVIVVGTLGTLALLAVGFYSDFLALGQASPEIRDLFTPINYVYASSKVFRQSLPHVQEPLEPVGLDAVHMARASARPRLIVFVLGETARSQQFSLNGYERETNPELARRSVISFSDVEACATATAASVPCIFSRGSRDEIDPGMVRHQEGLLDVLSHAGLQVLWRENNSGCKGVCDRVESETMLDLAPSGLCSHGECYDEALLVGLPDRWPGDRDVFLVLHQQGSHGPTYDHRVPEDFRHFLPVCAAGDLRSCSRQEIVNAYDNTMLYTDHFLAKVIDWLEVEEERYDTAMVYVSDHGESLGEAGIYLHGIPRAFAPPEQTHVPLIVWLSPSFQKTTGIRRSCLEEGREEPLSHDNIFHSMLGLAEVQTSAYKPELDFFAPCRTLGPGQRPSHMEGEPSIHLATFGENVSAQ